MLVRALLLIAAGSVIEASKDEPPATITTVGSQKLATASDCSKPVAFSATHSKVEDGKVLLNETLLDQGVGYAASTGTFTTYCPGLYQFSFAGYGDDQLKLSLRLKSRAATEWRAVGGLGPRGGSNLLLLRLALGDQLRLFLDSGSLQSAGSTSFSGYRIAKE